MPVLIRGSGLHFLETCPSVIRNSCDRVPANPNLQLQAGNFPTPPLQGRVAQGNENRENSPAPSVPGGCYQRIHLQSSAAHPTLYLPQGLNCFLFTHSTNPENTVLSVVASFCVPTGRKDPHYLLLPGERDSFRVQSAIRETNRGRSRQRWYKGVV